MPLPDGLIMSEVLIVDDKQSLCESLVANFRAHGIEASFVLNGKAALDALSKKPVGLMLLDVRLGEDDGLDTLKKALAISPGLPVIMMTAFATVESAVEAMKYGACDYVRKPVRMNDLLEAIGNLPHGPSKLPGPSVACHGYSREPSPAMKELYARALMIARSEISVIVSGESGTGKEALVGFIHENSHRRAIPMQKINCAAFPESLLDNELFGHEKGAYTGADSLFKGIFERSSGSTLFLDEITDMPLAIQTKILRVLQEQELRRIGGSDVIRVNVRFISATNKDLQSLVARGTFREDLYYRLNSAKLHIPPLRERPEDIEAFVRHFLDRFAREGGRPPFSMDPEVLEAFRRYSWPGNVRELKNDLHYAVTVCSGTVIGSEHISAEIAALIGLSGGFESPRRLMERDLILKYLQQTGFNKKKTAELLSMSRATLYHKMDAYGISQKQG
jgi:DNA-binding NtrC family response regulator